jgi:hypothetical protein
MSMGTPQKWLGIIAILAILLLGSAGLGQASKGGHGGGGHGGGRHGGHHGGHKGHHGWHGGTRVGIGIGIGPFWGLIGPHDMPIRMRIRTPIRTPTPMLMRIHPWSLPQRPSSLFNPQLQHQSSRLPSTGTIVTRPKVTTPMSSSAQADGGRSPPRHRRAPRHPLASLFHTTVLAGGCLINALAGRPAEAMPAPRPDTCRLSHPKG